MKTFACALLLAVSTLAAEGAVELQLNSPFVESEFNEDDHRLISCDFGEPWDEDTEGDDSQDDHVDDEVRIKEIP